jgi:hypothetical protein
MAIGIVRLGIVRLKLTLRHGFHELVFQNLVSAPQNTLYITNTDCLILFGKTVPAYC